MTAYSSPFGLPISGSVQTLAPVEQQTQRVLHQPSGPADDAQPETIVAGSMMPCLPAYSPMHTVWPVSFDRFGVGRMEWRFLGTGSQRYAGFPPCRANTMSTQGGGELADCRSTAPWSALWTRMASTPTDEQHDQQSSHIWIKRSGMAHLLVGERRGDIHRRFEQVFRQVSVYQVSTSGKQLIPDVRWLSWRNWRTQEVGEVLHRMHLLVGRRLRGTGLPPPSNLRGRQRVPVKNMVEIHPNSGINALNEEERGLLVHRIRLTMGDGNAEYALKITGDGVDYSDADANVKLTTEQPIAGGIHVDRWAYRFPGQLQSVGV